MGQCAVKTPLIALLNYEVGSIDDIKIDIDIDLSEAHRTNTHGEGHQSDSEVDSPGDHDTPGVEKSKSHELLKRQLYERALSKQINDNYTRKTRQEILVPLIRSTYPTLTIPIEIITMILDFEQDDSLQRIFKLYCDLKTATIGNIYCIPYLMGWLQMLVFGYLSSEYWESFHQQINHLLLLQVLGMILTCSAVIQLIGCSVSLSINLKHLYITKLINLKLNFIVHNLCHPYDHYHYMQHEVNDAWELYIPFQKWCNVLRVQNVYNVRNPQCRPTYVVAFYLLKPIFCLILGLQLASRSPHCLAIWLAFYLYFCILISINVFNKSVIGSVIGCTILILIISATSITIWPQDFAEGLRIAFEIFIFLIFLLYLFSLYLICCSGRVSTNHASSNMLGVWLILFVCYCLWVSELLTTKHKFNAVLMFSIYLLYISFQMLLLTSSDLQSVGINCYYQLKFMFIAILFGWIIDLDALSCLLFSAKDTVNSNDEDEEEETLN
eukprot:83097_1